MKFQKKVFNVTAFINVKIKIYYDAQHTALLLNTSDYTYL